MHDEQAAGCELCTSDLERAGGLISCQLLPQKYFVLAIMIKMLHRKRVGNRQILSSAILAYSV